MKASDFQVRRATIEDLPALTKLWQSMHLATAGLDRRLTEFQVAVNAIGNVVGAIGFQIAGKQALLHSEAYADFAVTDIVRPLLWDRLQMLAANHGICRVWSLESAPFWSQNILSRADASALEKLPSAWKNQAGEWRTIKLREDVDEILSLDKEFAMFAESERERSRSALQQAKSLKTLATIGAVVLGIAVAAGVLRILLTHSPTNLGH